MLISGGTPKAKAVLWHIPDVEVRERGDQKGLDTPVVHAVNDDLSMNGLTLQGHQCPCCPFFILKNGQQAL